MCSPSWVEEAVVTDRNQAPQQHPRRRRRLVTTPSWLQRLRRSRNTSFIVLSVGKLASVAAPSTVQEPKTPESPAQAPLLTLRPQDPPSSPVVSWARTKFDRNIPDIRRSKSEAGYQPTDRLVKADTNSTTMSPTQVSAAEPSRPEMETPMPPPAHLSFAVRLDSQAPRRRADSFSAIFANLAHVIVPQQRRWDVLAGSQTATRPRLTIDTSVSTDGRKTLPSQRPREVPPRVTPEKLTQQPPRVIHCHVIIPITTSPARPPLRTRASSRSLRRLYTEATGMVGEAQRTLQSRWLLSNRIVEWGDV
ncbi:hypothetical protein BT67DRAFT_87427 [Trichocladium antarcticum]|uniref:Uncharacterized protein n=1 Tax=Trichocladium antarcticum TaxID=1450529 RepID=A0AAN6UGH8_9PEZI|nr:hypothetical protein BT67DRAFT_87427 [Trichocladium antarcticum]